MPVTINGNGTITGISAGGLPDGCITADDLASGAGGKILQVKTATKTDSFTTTSSSFVDITGLSTTMSVNSGSKILLSYSVNVGANFWNMGEVSIVFVQDSTLIGVGTGGTNSNVTTFSVLYSDSVSNSAFNISQHSASFLFTPSDTNSHTYKLQIKGANTEGVSVNRWWNNANVGGISTLTLMEVAA